MTTVIPPIFYRLFLSNLLSDLRLLLLKTKNMKRAIKSKESNLLREVGEAVMPLNSLPPNSEAGEKNAGYFIINLMA